MYTGYFFFTLALVVQDTILSYIFTNLPANIQFIVVFVVAACREFDKRMRTKIVTKMLGELDEPAKALLAITVSSKYSFFFAIRLTGATLATVCCVVLMDLFLHSHVTYKLIKGHSKIKVQGSNNGNTTISVVRTKLILTELVEGLTPMTYAISMAMAYFGPNAKLFTNIGSSFWGEPIDDISDVFRTMFILFSVDTLFATINAICIWKIIKVNMLQEFGGVIKKYWLLLG